MLHGARPSLSERRLYGAEAGVGSASRRTDFALNLRKRDAFTLLFAYPALRQTFNLFREKSG